ncbi:MAG: gamma carbonic anhydrase family protein [Solobacterium sp.]|jgi:carbonic anhydrase/acetyltransferase-like protein (isoleucine patch superfamily)|nr:gamma carbonic anhydrase family protein [Solobacterium sp.]MCH4049702.1 gamma carbonic anhydrase family protein [Solobacterium sp.]MCH4073387.1 gamma carbonic anhydrase family protein [Solobacterium sp.]MCI1313046.1 gamma carbonic anhydrase family protein [Solobacterium sp.]MCI1345521.1 gamma carbonic anhydrase family protein [Solobacterium sp.]
MKIHTGKNTVLEGKISMQENCSFWHNAVLRADTAAIRIGKNTNIQDGVIIHAGEGHDVTLGDSVTAGHGAILHGCTVKDDVIIGMGAIIMNNAVIEDHCIVGAGALVTEDRHYPAGSLILGSPARVIRPLTEAERRKCEDNAAHYVKMAEDELDETEWKEC